MPESVKALPSCTHIHILEPLEIMHTRTATHAPTDIHGGCRAACAPGFCRQAPLGAPRTGVWCVGGIYTALYRRESLTGVSSLQARLASLVQRLHAAKAATAAEEEAIADAPQELYCFISSSLMRDPVRLPSSRKVIDRW